MFQCKDVTEEASNYLNKDLPWGKRVGLFFHILICSCCRNYLQQLKQSISLLSKVKPAEQTDTDTSKLAEKLCKIHQSDQK